MKKPAILVVDDDPQVLAAISHDLRREFRQDYRILSANSGPEALTTLDELRARAEPLALVLADQRMPEVEGVEVLAHALALFPEAKRALLTAYADTAAAIQAINSAQLDYYLLKPWDPPEQLLYPVLHDLLASWQATYRPRFAGLRLIGFQWSPLSHELKDFLSGYLVGYQWLDIEKDAEAATLLATTDFTVDELPVVICPDGRVAAQPDKLDLARHLGLLVAAQQELYDVVVIGAGPAGLAAAVYGASEGLKTLIIERQTPGGQAGASSRIENYLGFPTGLSGSELAHRAWSQAICLGAEFMAGSTGLVRARWLQGIDAERRHHHSRLRRSPDNRCQLPQARRAGPRPPEWGRRVLRGRPHRGAELRGPAGLHRGRGQFGWPSRHVPRYVCRAGVPRHSRRHAGSQHVGLPDYANQSDAQHRDSAPHADYRSLRGPVA
jgi:CheY-like chemotaxis protein